MGEEFFPERSHFPGKRQKLDFFCFYRVSVDPRQKLSAAADDPTSSAK